ncbi:flagellar protein FlaG [Thermodesulfovibrio aggregans]|uniref:Flagellar protein FlaG n=1 Tax=Thermodesulfovibrio aggregans TaxID=86166 RepID=A0A0U9HR18_9BACT|nr:flagellar protein FlaG [Thermodesulfovibrio aggregans]GAQ95252.1 flagellar protein FlaG [Thermodesulfovibrio aggregans]
MKLDGIEREQIIINPYRKLEVNFTNSQDNIQIQTGVNRKEQLNDSNLIQNAQKNTISQEELNKLMEELRHKFSMLEKYLQIDIDQQLQIPISKIIDMRTEEVIRQIPPDWIVEILRRMEELRGVLYSKEV